MPVRPSKPSRSRGAACLLAGIAWITAVAPALALDKDLDLVQISHRSWTDYVGTPEGPRAMAQTADGRFHVASAGGLMFFNGVTNRYAYSVGEGNGMLQASTINSLCIAADGALWAGFDAGGVSRLENADVQNHRPGEGPATGRIWAIDCAPDGSLWAAADGGLAEWRGGQWRPADTASGLPAGRVSGVHVARDGSVWAATDAGLFSRSSSKSRFELVGTLGGGKAFRTPIAETADGTLWAGTSERLIQIQRQSGSAQLRTFDEGAATTLLVDRDDVLWIGGHGIRRFVTTTSVSKAQRFDRTHRLSGDQVLDLAEDVEGNVWAATSAGLDRFSHAMVVHAIMAHELDGTKVVVAGNQDELWAADREHGVALRYVDGQLRDTWKVPAPHIAHRGADGSIWFGGPDGISRFQGDRFTTVTLPEGARGGLLQAMAYDQQGVLWISVAPQGVFRRIGSSWHAGTGVEALPTEAPSAMTLDPDGALWFGYLSAKLARLHNGTSRTFDTRDGLNTGAVLMLHAAGPRLWIGGDRSFALFDGSKFHVVSYSTCGHMRAVAAVHETATGAVWAYRPSSMALFKDGVQDALHKERMNCTSINGIRESLGPSLQFIPGANPMAATSDGRIWIVAGGRLSWTREDRVQTLRTPPFVSIDDNRDALHTDASGAWVFEAGTRTLQVSFTPWSLSSPQGMRFRHRLVGLDDQWRDGAQTAIAHYANLNPGKYRIEVQSRGNPELDWGLMASQSLIILPLFHETWWFHALTALILCALLALLFRLQLRRSSARLRERLEERTLERERIARELHDTLLQGMQGLILRFQAVYSRIPPAEPAAGMMEEVLDRADEVITESRDRVAGLREMLPNTTELPEVIADVSRQLTADRGMELTNTVRGTVRALDGSVNAELFLIAREALSNAIRHANCRHLTTELSYERFWIRLRIHDDGVGIPAEVLRNGGRDGHFGLGGMRERVQRLRGTLRISSENATGTEIEVRIPASLAYAKDPG